MKYRKSQIMEDNGWDIRGITNFAEVAKKAGVDRGGLSKVLRNKEICSEEYYLKIKKAIQTH